MQNKYYTTTEHILDLHTQDVNSYDIVVKISEEWNTTALRASIMVDYVLDKELYRKENKDE